jgi:cytidyltransferase-like protein
MKFKNKKEFMKTIASLIFVCSLLLMQFSTEIYCGIQHHKENIRMNLSKDSNQQKILDLKVKNKNNVLICSEGFGNCSNNGSRIERLNKATTSIECERTTTMPSAWVLGLYQLMKDTHEIFTQNKIEYWIQGGTLLGAVRHKGLIPWDDDIDINIKMSDENLFCSLISEFESLNYHVDVTNLGYKIVSPEIFTFGQIHAAPCIDVFLTIVKDDKIQYDPNRDVDWMHRDGGPLYVTNEELYPLKAYWFGECIVLGPNNPTPFLNACFGTNWFNQGVSWNHFFPIKEEDRLVELTSLDRVPAQPTGPLYNRVPISRIVRVYANMVGDLFHYGHVEFLKQASKLGNQMVVGLLSDETVSDYKRRPILSLDERIRTLSGCRYVDEIIQNSPLCITNDFIIRHKIDYVVHGDDFDKEKLECYFADPMALNIMRITPYTPGISTTSIIERVRNNFP